MKLSVSKFLAPIFLSIPLLLLLPACEDSDDEFDHDIPDGQGTIVVNNNTDSDIYVYINGIENQRSDHNDYEFYDRDPGTCRVVLEERDGDRSWFDYVDVLEGKKTVLDVFAASYRYNYDVYKRID